MWNIAYDNNKTILDKNYNLFNVNICKHCDKETNSTSTGKMQQLGNVIQVIHNCNVCNNYFIVEHKFV